ELDGTLGRFADDERDHRVVVQSEDASELGDAVGIPVHDRPTFALRDGRIDVDIAADHRHRRSGEEDRRLLASGRRANRLRRRDDGGRGGRRGDSGGRACAGTRRGTTTRGEKGEPDDESRGAHGSAYHGPSGPKVTSAASSEQGRTSGPCWR